MGAKKSLSVRVQERAQRVLPAARNRAQVVALRTEIEDALKDGCSLAMIWNTLHEEGTIQFGYETFRAHVRKLERPHPALHARPTQIQKRAQTKTSTKPAATGTEEKTSSFVFNPIPNEEDLY